MEQLTPNLCHFFSAHFLQYRVARDITQEEMSAWLHITPRSYIELEHGRSLCSARTFIFYLYLLPQDEKLILIDELDVLVNRHIADP